MGHGRLSALAAALAATTAACRAPVPVPPAGPHDVGEVATMVTRAPPTVRVEIVKGPMEALPEGATPMRDPRWIDGQWRWRFRDDREEEGHWAWEPGRWVDWPAGKAWYAPPTLTVSSFGKLFWMEGHVHPLAPAKALEAAPPVVAPTPALAPVQTPALAPKP